MSDQIQKCEVLSQLHNGASAWIIPNPWDAGSARIMESLGFQALATTSSGYANSLGRLDGQISLEEKLQHCTTIANATSIPVSADFEDGFGHSPEAVADSVISLAATGVAGCSIEDFSREDKLIYGFSEALDRFQAAAEAINTLGLPFQLCARAENFLRGNPDLDDTIKRLQAFEQAGAHLLYAPGLSSLDQVRQISDAVNKPINVLAPFFPGVSVEEFEAAGANRISLGSALSNAALKPLIDASEEMLKQGTFSWISRMMPTRSITELLSRRE